MGGFVGEIIEGGGPRPLGKPFRPPPASPLPPRKLDPFAAVLSYLVPGLGQLYQGRIGKGALFLVCLYCLFFYGMYLGHGENVYLPDSNTKQNGLGSWKPLGDLENRPHFARQVR